MSDVNTEEKKAKRPRPDKFPHEHVITILKENAKSRTANDRFLKYQTGMTVKQYIDILAAEPFNRTEAQTQADLRWDSNDDHRFVHVGPSVIDIPPPPPPPPPKEKKPRAKKLKVVEGGSDQPAA